MKIVKVFFQNIPSIFLALFFAAFSMGQLQRIQLSNDSAVYVHDILLLGFIGWVLVTDAKIRQQFQKNIHNLKKIIRRYPIETLWIMWLAGGMVLGALTGTVTFKSLLYLGRLAAYIIGVVFIRLQQKKLFPVSPMLLFVGTLAGIWGLIQYGLIPDTRFLHIFGWDNHYYRLIGPLLDPAFMGMILVLTFGMWQVTTLAKRIPFWLKRVAQGVLVVAIAATFSRASYIALAVFILLQLFKKLMKLRIAFLMSAIFILTLAVLPKPGGEGVNLSRTSTGEARLANAQQNLITLHGPQWIWGRGLFNSDAQQDYETPNHAQLPDSLPVLLLNATGVGGTLLSLMVLWKWLSAWWKEKPVWSNLLVATLIHSLFNNTFLQPFVFLTLWLMF